MHFGFVLLRMVTLVCYRFANWLLCNPGGGGTPYNGLYGEAPLTSSGIWKGRKIFVRVLKRALN